MALFGEKYGETVRTIIVENGARYSYELCGGVHVGQTSDIGLFVIVSEGSVSAGVRRVEALTGRGAIEYMQDKLDQLYHIAGQLGTVPDEAAQRVAALQEELASSKKQTTQLRRDLARFTFNEMIDNLQNVNGVPTLITQLNDTPMETMREMSDWFRSKVESGVFIAGTDIDGKPQLMVSVSDDLTKKGLHAGNIIKEIAAVVGGGGGGRPNMAQAGGKDSSKLSEALDKAKEVIAQSYNGG
jgi:alanyl-tRNA synthetase